MPSYKVRVTRTLTQWAEVVIDAENRDAVNRQAAAGCLHGFDADLAWDYEESDVRGPRVVDINEEVGQ